MKLLVLALALVAIVGGGMFYVDHRDKAAAQERDYGPCGLLVVRDASQALDDDAARLSDADKLASHTPRGSLAGPLADLQALAREIRARDTPACLARARFMFATEADLRVESLMDFAAERSAIQVDAAAVTAAEYRELLKDSLAKVQACAPACPEDRIDAAREASELAHRKEQGVYTVAKAGIRGH